MPNYSLEVKGNFTPIDYATSLSKTVKDYSDLWRLNQEKAQLEYLDRLELLSLIEAEAEEDPLFDKDYTEYNNKFNDFLESFNRGYDQSVILKGLEANKMFATKIKPIEKEFIKRNKMINELRLLQLENPSLMFDNDFTNIRISDMLKNPDMSYKSYNGNEIKKRTSEAIESLGNTYYRILLNPNSINNNNTDLYISSKVLLGYKLEEIINAILNDNTAPTELKDLIKNIKDSYDYDNLNLDLKLHVDYYIQEGAYLGAGKAQLNWMTNNNYQSDLDLYNLALKEAKLEREAAEKALKEEKAKSKGKENGWTIKKIPGDNTDKALYEATRGGETIVGRNLDEMMTEVAKKGAQLTPSEKIKSGNIVAGVITDKNNTENPVIGLKMLGNEKIKSQNYNYDNGFNGFNSLLVENRWGRKDFIKNKDTLDLQNAFEVSDFGTQEVKDAIFTAFTTNPNIFNLLSNNEIINSITEEYYQNSINNSKEIKNLYVELENLEKQIKNSKDRNNIKDLTNRYNTTRNSIKENLENLYNTASENADSDVNSLSDPSYYNDSEVKKVIITYIIHAIKNGLLSLIGVPGTDERNSQNDYILIQNRK